MLYALLESEEAGVGAHGGRRSIAGLKGNSAAEELLSSWARELEEAGRVQEEQRVHLLRRCAFRVCHFASPAMPR